MSYYPAFKQVQILIIFLFLIISKQINSEEKEPVIIKYYISCDAIYQNESMKMAFLFKIKDGWHIFGEGNTIKGIKSVSIEFSSPKGIESSKIKFQRAPQKIFIKEFEKEAFIYSDDLLVFSTFKVSKNISLGRKFITAIITYQACSEELCLPVKKITFKIPVYIVEKKISIKKINEKIFKKEEENEEN